MINRHFVFPTYHLGGSAAERHVTDASKALYHLNAFEASIRELRPHPRDHYRIDLVVGVPPRDVFELAVAEFIALELELGVVREELEAFRQNAQDAVDARFANRSRTV